MNYLHNMNHIDQGETQYESAYDAFINYMNVLTDFTLRVNKALPDAEVRNCRDVEKLQEMVIEQKAEIKKLKSKKAKAE